MTEPNTTQEGSGQTLEENEENITNTFSYDSVMKLIMNTPLTDAVNKLYEKTSYLDRYGGSLIVAVFTIICVSLFFSYSYLKNHSDVIKNNWQQNRCNPIYIPFA